MESKLKPTSPIKDFFQDKSVFLTGATGFLGKVFLEKLLRTTQVKNVYILARSKNQVGGQKRLEVLLNSKIFDTIRNKNEELLKKVIVINGDLTSPGLGMSILDAAMISNEVSIVIHSAATVKFDEPLREAIKINVGGSKNVFEFSKSIKFLKSLVYISTAYSNCLADKIDEKIYPVNLDPHLAILMAENLTEDQMECLSPSLIEANPNTYVYTKKLAESLGNSYKEVMPIAIVRPSIIVATHKDPIRGWISGVNGCTAALVGTYYGISWSFLVTTKYLDLIPADHVVNAILAAAWQTSVISRQAKDDVPVYNIVSGTENPIYMDNFAKFGGAGFQKFPLQKCLWKTNHMAFTDSYAKFFILDLIFHKFLGNVLGLLDFRKTHKITALYKSMEKVRISLKFFVSRTFDFSVENKNRLLSSLSDDDRQYFDFDITKLSWEEYMLDYIKGIRTYIFKEEEEGSKNDNNNVVKKPKGLSLFLIVNILLLGVVLLAMKLL